MDILYSRLQNRYLNAATVQAYLSTFTNETKKIRDQLDPVNRNINPF